jgi:hypothetical protein
MVGKIHLAPMLVNTEDKQPSCYSEEEGHHTGVHPGTVEALSSASALSDLETPFA